MIFRLSGCWSWLWCLLFVVLLDRHHCCLARRSTTASGCTFTHVGRRRTTSGNRAVITAGGGWDAPVVRSAHLSCREERQVFREASDAFLRIRSRKNDDEDHNDVEEVSRRQQQGKEALVEEVRSSAADSARGGGAAAAAALAAPRALVFWENMVAGAASRSVAQTVMHPANTMKTILQSSRKPETIAQLMSPQNFIRLTRGAGANFILSLPTGAVNFAVLEFIRSRLSMIVERNEFLRKRSNRIGPGLDFLSSGISTVVTSIVSTPQMMVVDNIMAGNYPGLRAAASGLATSKGLSGFYAGWWPGLAGKIPSYVRAFVPMIVGQNTRHSLLFLTLVMVVTHSH